MLPRPQEYNEVVAIDRNTIDQCPFILPTKEVNQITGYNIGLAEAATGMPISVLTTGLDRLKAVAFDADCQRSPWMCKFMGNFARALNDHLGRSQAQLWGPRDKDGATPILDKEEVFEAMAEVLAAPVVLGLVDRHQDWGGYGIGPEHWGKTLTYERPEFFSDKMPATTTVTPMPPPGFEDEGVDALRERLRRRVNELEEEARRARKAEGQKALNRKVLRELIAKRRAEACRPLPNTPKRCRRRHFRTSDPELVAPAVRRLREFLKKHREARLRMLLRLPEPDYEFPPETYWWREWSDAACEPRRERLPYDSP